MDQKVLMHLEESDQAVLSRLNGDDVALLVQAGKLLQKAEARFAEIKAEIKAEREAAEREAAEAAERERKAAEAEETARKAAEVASATRKAAEALRAAILGGSQPNGTEPPVVQIIRAASGQVSLGDLLKAAFGVAE